MNTPTHVIVNLLALGRTRASFAPAMIGAILPDVPMFGFYLWQRFIGTPERVIWSSTYFEPGWQAFFDVFNSLPLLALGLLIAWRLGASAWIVLFASMMLHCAWPAPAIIPSRAWIRTRSKTAGAGTACPKSKP